VSTPPRDFEPPLIDLGTEFDAVPSQSRPARVAISGPRSSLLRGRSAWLAVPLLAVLFLVSGAALPAPAPLNQLAQIPTGLYASVLVSGSTAIVVAGNDGHDRVSAYSLVGNGVIWSRKLGLSAEEVNIRVVRGVVVVTTVANALNHLGTEAFDQVSGKPLWHDSDSLSMVTTSGDLLMQDGPDGADSILQRVATRTGAIRWSLPLRAGCATAAGQDQNGRANALVAICFRPSTASLRSVDAPTLRAIDLDSGAVTMTRDLTYHTGVADFYLPPTDRLPSPELAIVGSLALVAHDNVPTPTIDAFNAATLAPAWTGMPVTSIDSLQACGEQICLYAGAASSVISRATGKPIPGLHAPSQTPARSKLVLVPVSPVYPNVPTFTIPQVPDGMAISVPKSGDGDAWVDEQRPHSSATASTLKEIQPIHDVGARSCFTTSGYLACATATNRLTFWRLPSS
jgi:hypothetical protein